MSRLPPAGRRAIAIVLALAGLVALARYGERRVEAMGGFPERAAAAGRAPSTNDFNVYWGAADALDAPDVLTRAYTDDGRRYTYPPFLAAALRPLRPLGPTGGAIVWFALALASSVVGTALAVRVALDAFAGRRASRPLPPDARRVVVAALAVGLGFAGRFVGDDLGNGNANGLVLVGCAAGTLAFVRGRDVAGAAAFAFAAALKVTPALVVVWLLATRRWRAAAAFVGVAAALVVGVPALVVGPSRAVALNVEFLTETRAREEASRDAQPVNGSSLRAAVHRVTTDAAATEGAGAQPLRLTTLTGAEADRVALGLAAACLVALGVVFARGAAASRDPRRAALDLALVVVAAALLSPITRTAPLVTAILPAAVLGAGAFGVAAGRAPRVLAALAVALSWLANASLVGRPLGRLAWGLNVLCLATVLVAAGLVASRRPVPAARRPDGRGAGGPAPAGSEPTGTI
jgi:hypothetical protein